ncbi:MAG TPA: Holliday junction resolvase RuvX, partial [Tenuifilaceae bacterium]|nr:Holliday junction resolvase RuvX [Tenuifilaceae bacterium]
IPTHTIFDFLTAYFEKENVELLIVGYPVQMNNSPSEAVTYIKPVLNRLKKVFPQLRVELVDERFTSKLAMQAMIDGGMKKKDRQNKATVDTISATIILQSYLESLSYKH